MVVSYTPALGQSVAANNPIHITFNIPMDSYESTDTVFTLDTIKITYLGQKISDYFEEPHYDSQSKTLTLQPCCNDDDLENPTSLASFIKNVLHQNSIDIQISLETVKVGNLPLVKNTNSSFVVRYKAETEKTPPEEIEFFVTREEISLSSHNSQHKFIYDSLQSFNSEKIHQNATKGLIYIFGTYKDEESGVKRVIVTEQYTNDTNGIPLQKPAFTPVSFSIQNNKNLFYTEAGGYTTFCIPYTLQSDDGAVLITIDVKDDCQNSAEPHNLIIIKKSLLTLDGVKLTNLRPENTYVYKELQNNMQWYYDNVKNIKIERFIKEIDSESPLKIKHDVNFYNTIYADTYFNGNDYTIICEYEGKDGEFSFKSGENGDVNDQYWYYSLEVDSLDNLSLKIIVEDFIGNQAERIYFFPEEPILISSKLNNDNNSKSLWFTGGPADRMEMIRIYTYVNQPNTCNVTSNGAKDVSTFGYYYTNQLKSLQLLPRSVNGLWGGISRIYTEADYESHLNLNTEEIALTTEPDLQKSELEHYVDIVCNIDETLWKSDENPSGFEKLLIQVTQDTGSALQSVWFEEGKTSVCLQRKISDMTLHATNVFIYGLRENNLIKSSKSYTISALNAADLLKYDNAAPNIRFGPAKINNNDLGEKTDKEFYVVYIDDIKLEGSGIASYDITINGVSEKPTILGIWDVLEYDNNNIIISAADMAENSITKQFFVKMDILDEKYSISKTDSNWTFSIPRGRTEKYQSFDSDKSDWKLEKVLIGGAYTYFLPQNSTFLKVERFNSEGTASTIPGFYYTGKEKNTGIYDLVLPNGNSKDSVAIQSDAPVLVQTLITPVSYNECKDWSTDKWDFYKKPVDEKIMTFTSDTVDGEGNVITYGNHNPKRYSIDLEKVPNGYCYTVVAHFADGTKAQSQVWQRLPS